MDPFATPELMEQRTQGAITTTTHPFLENELAAASRAIRNECRWHIAPLTQLTYRRNGRYAADVWLPAMQIQSITGVVVDGSAWSLDLVEFDADTGWTNLYGRRVAVEYVAGHSTTPEDIEALTLELAAGALGSPLGLTREQAGGVSATFGRVGGGLTLADKNRLAEYRIGRLP